MFQFKNKAQAHWIDLPALWEKRELIISDEWLSLGYQAFQCYTYSLQLYLKVLLNYFTRKKSNLCINGKSCFSEDPQIVEGTYFQNNKGR